MGWFSKLFKLFKTAPIQDTDVESPSKTNETPATKSLIAPLDDYIVIDLETTGLSKFVDRIIEIGMVRYSGNLQVETFSKFINPEKPIPKRITEITGITDADVTNEPVFTDISSSILNFIGDCPLVAHNAKFDIGFLCEAFRRTGTPATFAFIDTLDMARTAFPDAPNHKLDTLLDHLSIEKAVPQSHRALSDALQTNELFLRCAQHCKLNIQNQSVTLPPQLSDAEMKIAKWAKDTLSRNGRDVSLLAFEARSKFFEISYYYKILNIKLGKNLTYVFIDNKYEHLIDSQRLTPGSKDESHGKRYSFQSVSELADIEPILIAAYDHSFEMFTMAKQYLTEKNWKHHFDRVTQI